MYNQFTNPNPAGYGYPMQPQNYYAWTYTNQGRETAQNTQPLNQEMIDVLTKKNQSNVLNMKYSQEDIWKSICTHKHKNGAPATKTVGVDEENHTVLKCDICGETIVLKDYTPEDIKKTIADTKNLMQLAKLVYLDVPVEFATNYFQFGMLLDSLPDVVNLAFDNYAKYNQNSLQMVTEKRAGGNLFQTMSAMSNGYYGGMAGQPTVWSPAVYSNPNMQPMQQQPMNGYAPAQPQQAPMMPQQPMMQQPMYQYGAYAAPMAPDANPMMYGGTMPQAAPAPMQAPPAGIVPGAAPVGATAAPAAPAQEEVQQTKQFNL